MSGQALVIHIKQLFNGAGRRRRQCYGVRGSRAAVFLSDWGNWIEAWGFLLKHFTEKAN